MGFVLIPQAHIGKKKKSAGVIWRYFISLSHHYGIAVNICKCFFHHRLNIEIDDPS